MKVIFPELTKLTTWGNLEIGNCAVYAKKLIMKVRDINAIDVQTGEIFYISNSDLVIKVKATITVEYE